MRDRARGAKKGWGFLPLTRALNAEIFIYSVCVFGVTDSWTSSHGRLYLRVPMRAVDKYLHFTQHVFVFGHLCL